MRTPEFVLTVSLTFIGVSILYLVLTAVGSPGWLSKDGLAWDFVKAIIGPFIGAGLAFLATKTHDYTKTRSENLGAVRLAIATIGDQLGDVVAYRKALYEALDKQAGNLPPGAPRWAFTYPINFAFRESAQVNMQALSFLFETTGHDDLYVKVARADRTHAYVRTAANCVLESALKVQEQVAEMMRGAQDSEQWSIEDARRQLGRSLTYIASDHLSGAIEATSDSAIDRILKAAEALKRAALKHYPGAKALQSMAVAEDYLAGALPPLPKVFIDPDGARY